MGIVAVRSVEMDKIHYYEAGNSDLKVGDIIVVENKYGYKLGEVASIGKKGDKVEVRGSVVRKAKPKEIERKNNFNEKEKKAYRICKDLINKYQLPMKLVNAKYNFQGTQITFYFTAPQRVDFRQLVRELSSKFHLKIELRQIGPRDETKMLGGIGHCGRDICCHTFMNKFEPVTLNMAYTQCLGGKDSESISGLCGRLCCCLLYENNFYEKMRKKMPDFGDKVITPEGEEGEVTNINTLKGTVHVLIDGEGSYKKLELPYEKVNKKEK